ARIEGGEPMGSPTKRGVTRRGLTTLNVMTAVVVLLAGCSQAPPASNGGAATAAGSSAASGLQKKTLTIAYGRAVPHIGPLEGGVNEFREIAQAGLLALDPVSNQVSPRLAERVPSI